MFLHKTPLHSIVSSITNHQDCINFSPAATCDNMGWVNGIKLRDDENGQAGHGHGMAKKGNQTQGYVVRERQNEWTLRHGKKGTTTNIFL